MNINFSAVIIDAAGLEPESAFWHRLLGGSIAKTATHHFLRIEGFPVFVIQLAQGHVPPQWWCDGQYPSGAPLLRVGT